MASSNCSNGLNLGKPTPLKKMECLICSKVVFPPVMQCKNWHLVCNNCRQQQEICPDPECEEDLASATRSAVAEIFLEKYVLRCKFFYEGTKCMECTLKDEKELMVAHEAICHFREVKCLVPGCYKLVQLTLLIKHFEKEHSMLTNTTSEVHLNISQLIMNKLMCTSSSVRNKACYCNNIKPCVSVPESIGEKYWKSFPAYATQSGNIFLIVFRLTSVRSPLFEISTVVYGYYPNNPKQYICKISANNESDLNVNAYYKWEGPIDQPYTLTPYLSWTDELGKLKWVVHVKIEELKRE